MYTLMGDLTKMYEETNVKVFFFDKTHWESHSLYHISYDRIHLSYIMLSLDFGFPDFLGSHYHMITVLLS